MDYILIYLLFVVAFLVNTSVSYPTNSRQPITSPYSSHKNYNLLSPRGVCGIERIEDKLFGANDTTIDEFPWMVRLGYNNNGVDTGFQCAGVLINKRYVLTAAHCITGKVRLAYGDVVKVRLGEHDERTNPDCEKYSDDDIICADPVVDINIEELITHKNYDLNRKHHDIALIRLKENVPFTMYIKPICLPLNGEKSLEGQMLVASGWGKTESKKPSPVKLKAALPIMSQSLCKTRYASAKREIIEQQLCAGGKKGIDACNGDSGGPLMQLFPQTTIYYVEGIVSFGLKDCGTRGVPGIYTRVSEYIEWILDNMKSF